MKNQYSEYHPPWHPKLSVLIFTTKVRSSIFTLHVSPEKADMIFFFPFSVFALQVLAYVANLPITWQWEACDNMVSSITFLANLERLLGEAARTPASPTQEAQDQERGNVNVFYWGLHSRCSSGKGLHAPIFLRQNIAENALGQQLTPLTAEDLPFFLLPLLLYLFKQLFMAVVEK